MTEIRRTSVSEAASLPRNSPVKRYASIVENAVEGIFQSTPDGKYFFVNPALARLYGYDSAVELLKSVTDISQSIYVDPQVRHQFKRLMAEHGEVHGLEYQVRRKDGKIIWISEHARAVTEDNGAVSYYEGFIQDITERKRTEDELRAAKEAAEAANVAKSQFLAVMSHEIRTPMNGVIGLAALLQDTKLTPEQLDFVTTIRQSGDALLTIIDEILDFSNLESGHMELENEPFVLRDCVVSGVELLAPIASAKGLNLSFNIADEVPGIVVGDSNRLRQILGNLLGNAVKFTAHGEVVLTIGCADSAGNPLTGSKGSDSQPNQVKVAFSIRDTGIGITAESLGKLFQPVTQVDASTTRRYGGTGLGLAVSKRLATLMGGELTVESVLGQGSIFNFTAAFGLGLGKIPGAATNVSSPPHRDLEQAPSAIDGTEMTNVTYHRILLAEDNIVNQKVAQRMLNQLGYRANVVVNGIQVLDSMSARRYDIILLDLQMPEMDGLEAARQLRRRRYPPGIRPWIIAVTANAMPGDRELCLAAGMDDYITKPLKSSELAAALERARPHFSEPLT